MTLAKWCGVGEEVVARKRGNVGSDWVTRRKQMAMKKRAKKATKSRAKKKAPAKKKASKKKK
jgi:hypothetical protein